MTKTRILDFDLEPVPASRPRVSRRGTYYAKPYEAFKQAFRKKVMFALSGEQKPLFSKYEPISITITCYMKMNKSISQKRKDILNNTPHLTKPDLDNLAKSILDGLNGYAYLDDSQIFDLRIKKLYSDKPRIQIEIESKYEHFLESTEIIRKINRR